MRKTTKVSFNHTAYFFVACILNLLMFAIPYVGSDGLSKVGISFVSVFLLLMVLTTLLLNMSRTRTINWSLAIALSAIMLLIVLSLNPLDQNLFDTGDEIYYKEMARALSLSGEIPSVKEVELTSFVYIAWNNLLYLVFRNVGAIKIFNIVFFISGSMIMYSALTKLFSKRFAYSVVLLQLLSPLSNWFANSYYKDAFLFFFLCMFFYSLVHRYHILTMLTLAICILTRPGYIMPMGYCASYTVFVQPKLFIRNPIVKKLLLWITMFGVLVTIYFLANEGVMVVFERLSINRMRLSPYNVVNYLTIPPIITSLSIVQPMPINLINLNSMYYKLDLVGYLEGALTIMLLPYVLYFLAVYRKRLQPDRFITNAGLIFYFSVAMIGYIFTYRHIAFLRWFFYALGVRGFEEAHREESGVKLFLCYATAVVVFIGLNLYRGYINIRS